MHAADYWHGLTWSWWAVCAYGVFAMPSELAASWLDAGQADVFLGTYEQATKVWNKMYEYEGDPNPPQKQPEVVVPEPVAAGRYEDELWNL